jgi:hypothetical protein
LDGIGVRTLTNRHANQALFQRWITGNELITDVPKYKQKNTHPEISSRDFLLAWLKDHPTFKASEAVKAFKADGRTQHGCYPELTKAVADGTLKKLSPGNYARADVKQIAGPKKRAVTEHRKTFDRRAEDVILSYAKRNHGRFNTAKLVEIFLAEGRARNSLYASIDALMKAKLVKRAGDAGSGQYVLLAKASVKKPKRKPAKKKANGRDPDLAAAEAILHG